MLVVVDSKLLEHLLLWSNTSVVVLLDVYFKKWEIKYRHTKKFYRVCFINASNFVDML